RILDVRKLVTAGIGKRFDAEESVFRHLLVELGAGHGVCKRYLDGFAVEFLGEVDGLVDGLGSFAREADDEVAVDLDADLAAILHEGTRHFDGGTLLDVLENLRVAGFETDDEETRAAIGHRPKRFIVAVNASGGGPAELVFLETIRKIDDAVLANVERVIVEEDFLHLREVFESLRDFALDVRGGTSAPRVAGDRLRPHAEGAKRRATACRVKRNERMQKERHVVIFDF